jgi:trk system potassium uptake protein TrkA
MNIIIVGIGKLGEFLAKSLVREGNAVTLIDTDFKRVADTINNEDLNYVKGNALDISTLTDAGVENCDILISAIDKDELNVMTCLLAKKLGAKHTIARIRNTEYISSISLLKEELGLSMIINPERLTSEHIVRVLNTPSAIETTTFFKGRIQMISLKIKDDDVLKGASINSISRKLDNAMICAIKRDTEVIIPTGDTKIKAGDKIYVTGTPKTINTFLKYSKRITEKTRKVIISGGSDTAIYVARLLLDMGIDVKIIEISEERCEYLSSELPNAIIINGDTSDQNILLEEGLEKCDAFISLNSIDEENIIYSIFASLHGVPKVITKINHMEMDGITEKLNIDTIITPHQIATNQIVKYVRAMQNSESSSCAAVYQFENEQFEMLEFNVKSEFIGRDIKIKDLKLKPNILILAILRDKNIIIPKGVDEIKFRDTVIVIDGNNEVKKLEDILEQS